MLIRPSSAADYYWADHTALIVKRAKNLAGRRGHARVGPLHLLQSFVQDKGYSSGWLRMATPNLKELRSEVEAALAAAEFGTPRSDRAPQPSATCKALLVYARAESLALDCNFVASEHVLLALLRWNEIHQRISPGALDFVTGRDNILEVIDVDLIVKRHRRMQKQVNQSIDGWRPVISDFCQPLLKNATLRYALSIDSGIEENRYWLTAVVVLAARQGIARAKAWKSGLKECYGRLASIRYQGKLLG